MGAPIHRLLIGSNCNDILTRFLTTGSWRPQRWFPTLSPSMDIQVSSNFERLLFEMNGRDGGMTAEQLRQLPGDRSPRRRGRPVERVAGAVVPGGAVRRRRHAGHHARPCTPRPGCWSTRTRRSASARRAAAREPGVADGRAGDGPPGQVPGRGRGGDGRPARAAAPPRRPLRAARAHHGRAQRPGARSRPSLHVTPPVAKVTPARSPEQAAPPGSAVVPTSPRWIPVLSDGGLRCQPPHSLAAGRLGVGSTPPTVGLPVVEPRHAVGK